jgi:ATP synthase protein I
MTEFPDDPRERDALLHGVRLHKSRYLRWEEDGDPSVVRRLGQIGVLGWIIVLPMLLGVFGGRWLDTHFHSGLFCTAPLLMAGAALGCWSAWKWMAAA